MDIIVLQANRDHHISYFHTHIYNIFTKESRHSDRHSDRSSENKATENYNNSVTDQRTMTMIISKNW